MVNLTIRRAIDVGLWCENAKGLVLGFSMAQLALVALWLVFGRWNLVVRVLIVLAVGSFLADLNASVTRSIDLDQWLGVMSLLGFAVATPLLVLRLLGLRWVDHREPAVPESTDLRAQHRQFSLGTLLVWVTGSCVVLGGMRGVGFPWEFALHVIVHCIGFAVVALVSLGAVFSAGHVTVRLLAVAVASPMLGWLMGGLGSEPILVSLICAVEMLGISFGAAVLRMSGLRLGWVTPDPG